LKDEVKKYNFKKGTKGKTIKRIKVKYNIKIKLNQMIKDVIEKKLKKNNQM
jgi:hypothetical protein